MYHYPGVFAMKAQQQAAQEKADKKTEWACSAIDAQAPLLVDENHVPLTLKDGVTYYGASDLGDMTPLPPGYILQDATGAAGTMIRTADGQVVSKVMGFCPSRAGQATVTTMGQRLK